jgi:hypothetical protein
MRPVLGYRAPKLSIGIRSGISTSGWAGLKES